MECSCGGSATSASYERKKLNMILEVLRCKSCGREGSETLIEKGTPTLRGPEARNMFNRCDENSGQVSIF